MADFVLTIPAHGEGAARRDEVSGPDIDAILRDLTRDYMREANRSPADMANSLGITKRHMNAWLGGEPGTLDLLSRFVAAAGVENVDQLIGGHPAWKRSNRQVATMKDMLVSRWAQLTDLDGVRFSMEMRLLARRLPETMHFLRRGLKDALDYAEEQGVDVRGERRAMERGLRRSTDQVQRAAGGD